MYLMVEISIYLIKKIEEKRKTQLTTSE